MVKLLSRESLGGDQQVGARIAEGTVDLVIFFWDPLQPQPHDPDVKALLRIAVVWNVPVACNRASADYMISSPLLTSTYERQLPEYEAYQNRMVKVRRPADVAERASAT
jgi:methylglyoxal synthase